MTEVLFELSQVFRSKQHKLTPQEANALINCKNKALTAFFIGSFLGGGVSYLALAATRLRGPNRVLVSGGVAFLAGSMTISRSLNSSVDRMLELEGTVMQRELANIVIKKYGNDPRRMRIIYKHFYSEEVFDDSNSEKPKFRWRYRNFFAETVVPDERKDENDLRDDSQIVSQNDSHGEYSDDDTQSESSGTRTEALAKPEGRKLNSESKKAPTSYPQTNSAVDETDPLDCIFGYPETQEIYRANPSTTPPKIHSRKDKRAHRRRRMRQNQDSEA